MAQYTSPLITTLYGDLSEISLENFEDEYIRHLINKTVVIWYLTVGEYRDSKNAFFKNSWWFFKLLFLLWWRHNLTELTVPIVWKCGVLCLEAIYLTLMVLFLKTIFRISLDLAKSNGVLPFLSIAHPLAPALIKISTDSLSWDSHAMWSM